MGRAHPDFPQSALTLWVACRNAAPWRVGNCCLSLEVNEGERLGPKIGANVTPGRPWARSRKSNRLLPTVTEMFRAARGTMPQYRPLDQTSIEPPGQHRELVLPGCAQRRSCVVHARAPKRSYGWPRVSCALATSACPRGAEASLSTSSAVSVEAACMLRSRG